LGTHPPKSYKNNLLYSHIFPPALKKLSKIEAKKGFVFLSLDGVAMRVATAKISRINLDFLDLGRNAIFLSFRVSRAFSLS
jgi:hypothetical protein